MTDRARLQACPAGRGSDVGYSLPSIRPLAKPAISNTNKVIDRPTRIASAFAVRRRSPCRRSSENSALPRLSVMRTINRMTTMRMSGLRSAWVDEPALFRRRACLGELSVCLEGAGCAD